MAAVVIVWQSTHMIFLRYTLLIGLGLLAWPLAVSRLAHPRSAAERSMRVPFAMLAAFLLWAIFVALVVSGGAWRSLSDLRAEWLAPTLILLLGYGLALRYDEDRAVVRVLFLAFILHAFIQVAGAGVTLARGQAIDFSNFAAIGDHKANVTYTNALAMAMLVAHTAARAAGGGGFLGIDARWSLAAFVLLLGSTVLATTRNGLMVFGLLMLVAFVLIARRLHGRASRAAWATLLAGAVIALVGAVAGLKADTRWSSFVATVPVAWDTDGNRQWLRGEGNETNLPFTATGKRAEASAYFRIAYVKEAARLILENPWGTHVGRDSFRRAIHEKYGTAGMARAHNGFLDLGVSMGIPGMLLFMAFLGSLVSYAVGVALPSGSGLRLALVLVVAAYAARTLLDATTRDHIVQEFMLTAGVLCGALVLASGPRERG